jgi:hypothetical protein
MGSAPPISGGCIAIGVRSVVLGVDLLELHLLGLVLAFLDLALHLVEEAAVVHAADLLLAREPLLVLHQPVREPPLQLRRRPPVRVVHVAQRVRHADNLLIRHRVRPRRRILVEDLLELGRQKPPLRVIHLRVAPVLGAVHLLQVDREPRVRNPPLRP